MIENELVLFITGKGNNLHEVECPEKTTFLVSMPKKYRQTVWLKKGDCIVIDPIIEGKKVRGEIIGLLTSKTVLHLIRSFQWPPKGGADGDSSPQKLSDLIEFFNNGKQEEENSSKEDSSYPWPSSEEEESEEEGSEDELREEEDV